MKDSIYSKIVTALRRMAADELGEKTESKVAPTTGEEQSTYEQKTQVEMSQAEALREQEKKRREEEIEKQYPDPTKVTRQEGPQRDVSQYPVLTIKTGDPAYAAGAKFSLEYIDMLEGCLKTIDDYVSETAFIANKTAAFKKAYADPSRIVQNFDNAYDAQIGPVKSALKSAFEKSDGVKTISLGNQIRAFISKRSKTGAVEWAKILSIIRDPQALKKEVERLRSKIPPSSSSLEKGPERAAELEKLVTENGEILKEAARALEVAAKLYARKAVTAEQVLTGMIPIFVESGHRLKKKAEDIHNRAARLNVSIAQIAAKYKGSAAELKEAQNSLRDKIKLARSIGKQADELISSLGESVEKSSAIEESLMVKAADMGSWAETMAELDALSFGMTHMYDDLPMMNIPAKFISALNEFASPDDQILNASSEVAANLQAIDVAAAEVGMQATETPVAQSEQEVQPEQEAKPESAGWMESLLESLAPAQEMVPAMAVASDNSGIDKTAAKDDEPKRLTEDITETIPAAIKEIEPEKQPTEEMLKTPYLPESEIGKAELEREKALLREKRRQKKEEKGRRPSKEEKEAREVVTRVEFMDQARLALGDKWDVDRLINARQENTEALRQFKDSKKRSDDIVENIAASVPEYKETRKLEPEEMQVMTHVERRKALGEKLASQQEAAAQKASELFKLLSSSVKQSKLEHSVVNIEKVGTFIIDADEDNYFAFLQKRNLERMVEGSFSALVKNAKSILPKGKYDEGIALVERVGKLIADVSINIGTRVNTPRIKWADRPGVRQEGAPPETVEKVKEKLGPSLEKAEEEIKTEAPSIVEPLAGSEGEPKVEAEVPTGGAAAVLNDQMIRHAEDIDESTQDQLEETIVSQLGELNSMLPGAIEFFSDTADGVIAFADKSKSDIKNITSSFEKYSKEAGDVEAEAEEEPEDSGDWAARTLEQLQQFLAPQEMELAVAVAAKKAELERIAGEFDKFDVSCNRLEIIEGEDGKRHLVINKGLRNLVSKRVREMLHGGFKCGDSVHVDLVDHMSLGVVKAYLGAGIYRIEVDGAVMEVPAKNVLGLDGNPWR